MVGGLGAVLAVFRFVIACHHLGDSLIYRSMAKLFTGQSLTITTSKVLRDAQMHIGATPDIVRAGQSQFLQGHPRDKGVTKRYQAS